MTTEPIPEQPSEHPRCEHGALLRGLDQHVKEYLTPELAFLYPSDMPFIVELAATAQDLSPDSVDELGTLLIKSNCYRCFCDYVEPRHLTLREMLQKFGKRVDEAVSAMRRKVDSLEHINTSITATREAIDRALEYNRVEPQATGYVYAIEDGEFVKIGWAADPMNRLAQLQTAAPRKLRLLGTIQGPFSTERDLHARFAGFRHRGEWFKLTDSIRSYFLSTKAQRAKMSDTKTES